MIYQEYVYLGGRGTQSSSSNQILDSSSRLKVHKQPPAAALKVAPCHPTARLLLSALHSCCLQACVSGPLLGLSVALCLCACGHLCSRVELSNGFRRKTGSLCLASPTCLQPWLVLSQGRGREPHTTIACADMVETRDKGASHHIHQPPLH